MAALSAGVRLLARVRAAALRPVRALAERAAALPHACDFSPLCVARCLTGARGTGSSWRTFRTCGLAAVSCFSHGPQGAGCGEVRVPIYRLSGHLLLWRWPSRFCVVVSPGKGSSQGSLACPRARRLLCRPVLEAHPLRTFQMLLEALRLESFSPSPSPAYAKTPGWNLGPGGRGAAHQAGFRSLRGEGRGLRRGEPAGEGGGPGGSGPSPGPSAASATRLAGTGASRGRRRSALT